MALIVRAFPVRDRVGVDSFVDEVQRRDTEAREFYVHFGVRREAWFYQAADGEAFVIGVTDVGEPVEPKAAEYAAADEGFAAWFKARVFALSGVDCDTAPLGPISETVLDSFGSRFPEGAPLVVHSGAVESRDALMRIASEMQDPKAVFVQNTDRGAIAITVLSQETAAQRFARAEQIFDFQT